MSFRKKPKTINLEDVDPSVFYYDEVYDEMKNDEKTEQDAAKAGKEEKQGSKYIQGLLESAELRKTEKEIRKFKRYAKDREKAEEEGSINQTEVYITSAYKKKLDEIRKLDGEKGLRARDESDRLSVIDAHKYTNDRNDQRGNNPRPSYDESSSKSRISPSETKTQEPKPNSSGKDTRTRHLRTSGQRRRYLEEVLVKRTVGSKFEEALERYKQRKDMT